MTHRLTGAHHIPLTDPQIGQYIQELTFSNPFEPDKDFQAFFRSPTHLIVPRAFTSKPKDAEVNVVDAQCNIEVAEGYALRDYQEQAVTEIVDYFGKLQYGQLLLTAQTGSGKSYALAGLLARLGKKTLILSHLTILNTQIYNELKGNLVNTSIGIINSSTEALPDIAITSYQALAASKDLLQRCADTYSVLCVDEGENAVTSSRLKVIFQLRHKYFIMLTATPTKELVQQTKAVEYVYGDKIVSMSQPEETKVHSNHLMVDYRSLVWNSPIQKNVYKTSLGKFMLRSRILPDMVRLASSFRDIPGCVWVVVDLSAVKVKLKELLEAEGITTEIIDASTSAKKRAEILLGISNGTVKCVLGSKPLSAGLSIKELLVGIRLLPSSSSEEELRQSTGRLNRFCEFKKTYTPLWVDFVCEGSLMYGAKLRYKLYQKSTLGAHFCKPEDAAVKAKSLVLGT